MAVLVLFAAFAEFVLYGAISRRNGSQNETPWRRGFVQALVLLALLVYVSTQLLSAFNLITYPALLLFWVGVTGALALVLWRRKEAVSAAVAALRYVKFTTLELLWFLGFLVPLLFLAVWVPPNNFDAMNYHMARVPHWVQDRNVEFFPVVYLQQLYHTPLAEYVILHLYVLSAGDWLSGLVQYGAMTGSLVLVSLLARQAGLAAKGQVLTALLAFSVPMGLLQSTSTQNDYTAAFFLLVFLYYGLELLRQPSARVLGMAALGLGLGGLTKYTVLVYALPFCVWIGIAYWRKKGVKATITLAAGMVLTLLLCLVPHWIRNYQSLGNPIGVPPGSPMDVPLSNYPINFSNTVSNLIRNFFNQFGLPYEPYNQAINRLVGWLHRALGMPVDALGKNYLDERYNTSFYFLEDSATNLLVVLLFSGAIGLAVVHRRRLRPAEWLFLACILVAYALFSALLRYQPWHSRLLLPLTLTATVWTGVMLGRYWTSGLQQGLAAILLLSCVPYVYLNKAKPLFVVETVARRLLNRPHEVIPDAAFEQVTREAPTWVPTLKTYYQHETDSYRLAASTPQPVRQRFISLFDSLQLLQRQPAYRAPREQSYFESQRASYPTFERLTDTLVRYGCRNVGLDLAFAPLEYPIWVLCQEKLGADLRLEYIRYWSELKLSRNQLDDFQYEAVLTNFDDLVKRYPPDAIKAYYGDWPGLKLIVFKRPMRQIFRENRQLLNPIYWQRGTVAERVH